MILQYQSSPQDWATSWWSEASLHQTWSKLFSPTFQCFLCGFPAGRIYIFVYPFFTLFFWPTWQNCSKLGAEKLSTLNVAAFPGQGSLFSDKRFFWKENKSNRPHVWAIRSKRKRKSRPGASSKRPRGGGGRIMLWDQDVVACSGKYFITFVRDKDLVSPLCMSMFVSSPTFSFSSSSIAIRIVSISLDSFRLQKQVREVAKY